MFRRHFLAVAAALLALAGPAAFAADRPFASDRISVVAEGAGPDVVLIPGLTSSPGAWRGRMLPGYRYHYVQVKGFAGTPAEGNAAGPVVGPVAGVIARYITEQGLQSPSVVGHSMGGTVALMIAARHPGLASRFLVVDQLPFMGAVYGPPGTTAASVRPTADAIRARLAGADDSAWRGQMEAGAAAMVRNEDHRKAVVADAIASDRKVSAEAFHELIVTDLVPELAAVTAPVTVLYVTPAGPFTDAGIDALYRETYAPLKKARLVRIPDAAHFIMADNPARFQAEMKAFLIGS
jgi:pimeloyl-ACP methyl ester carboxylesterase